MNLTVIFYNQHWFHLASLIEAVMSEKEKYDKITVHFLNKGLKVQPLFLDQAFPLSNNFGNSPEKKLERYLTGKIGNRKFKMHFPDLSNHVLTSQPRSFQNIEELKGYKISGRSVGFSIASHLISHSRDSSPSTLKYSNWINSALDTDCQIVEYVNGLNLKHNEDEFWICNGRPFHERSTLEAVRAFGIKTRYYEVHSGGNLEKGWTLNDFSPHDRVKFQNAILDSTPLDNIESHKVDTWFNSRKNPKNNLFTGNQKENFGISHKTPYIAYFSSSDDELAAISDDWVSPWGNQILAVQKLIRVFAEFPQINLVIRVHPNQGNKSRSDKARWKSLRSSRNTIVIPYGSKIDSYKVMSDSKGVITHGSTMGIEAAYMEKRLAFLSHSMHDILIPAPLLATEDAIRSWVVDVARQKSEDRREELKMGAQIFATFMLVGANPWKEVTIFHNRNRVIGFLNGESLRPRNVSIILTRLYLWVHREIVERKLEELYWFFRVPRFSSPAKG